MSTTGGTRAIIAALLANLGILPGLWSGFWTFVAVLFWPAVLIGAPVAPTWSPSTRARMTAATTWSAWSSPC